MTVFESIKHRRSIFPSQYNDEAISQDELEQLLEAANWAPTHRKTEPWRFKVLRGKSKTKFSAFLGSLYLKHTENPSKFKHRKIIDKFQQSSCVIAICMQRDPKESVPEWEEVAAVSMAVQNMWLTATELQIGSYWSSPQLIQYFNEFFEFSEGERCLGLFYLGKTDQKWPEGERKSPIKNKVQYWD